MGIGKMNSMLRLSIVSFAAVLMLAASVGCYTKERHMMCDACIEKDGQMFCGRSDINMTLEPDTTEDEAKIAAGKAGCVEYAARKGGGYSGPPYQEALKACAASVTLKDLRRTHCEDRVTGKKWRPQDGV